LREKKKLQKKESGGTLLCLEERGGAQQAMFLPAMFDVGGAICPAAPPSGVAAVSGLVADGASQSAHALSGANPSALQAVSLDGDAEVYNNTHAPHNCVGNTCDGPPFSGSPWTVPAPSHWYATAPPGAEGMAPSQALAAAPVALPAGQEPAAVFGPQPRPSREGREKAGGEAPAVGPLPKPPSVALGLCSVRYPPTGKSVQVHPILAAWEQVWAKEAASSEHEPAPSQGIRPTPGHAIMCGNALVLGAATTLLEFGHKTVQGEACSPDDVARDFKESAACHAEAVTPIGGHWLRHHVLKAESPPAEIAL